MNTDFALLDAALARAREGYRVLDEIARFIFQNGALYEQIRLLRHELAEVEKSFGIAKLIGSRVGGDVGERAHSAHAPHTTLAIIRANANRVTEALRELESFASLYAPDTADRIAELRHTTYTVERALVVCTPHFYLHNYFYDGVVYPLSDSVDEIISFVQNGALVVQLRDKKSSLDVVVKKTQAVCAFLKEYNRTRYEKVLFIINDHPLIAARFPVAGVHVGQDVKDVNHVRRLIGSNKIIGRSNRSVAEMKESIAQGADYVSIGPIYKTATKPDRQPVGFKIVSALTNFRDPWVAIGGVTRDTIDELREHGAKNVAVVAAAADFFKKSL